MKLRAWPYLAAASVILMTLAGVWTLDRSEQQHFRQQRRTDALNQLSTTRARLEGALNSRLLLTEGLVAHVSTHPEIDPAEFQNFARVLAAKQIGIHTIELAKQTTLRYLYPPGSQAIPELANPQKRDAVAKILRTRRTVVTGPLRLKDNTVAVIGHTPIFLTPKNGIPNRDSYWGLVSIAIDQEPLLAEAGLLPSVADSNHPETAPVLHQFPPQKSPVFSYAIRAKGDGSNAQTVFWGDPGVFQQDPVILDISLPHSAWQIAAVPMGGWPTTYPSAKWLWAASVAIALLAGALVLILVQTPTRSRETVERATTALMKANEQLHTILEAVPGIVSWISSDLRYLGANRHLAAAYQRSPEDFHGQELGFLHGQTEFTEFVRRFFASSDRETSGEVATQIDDSLYNYLIVAQKYDQDRAAFTIGIDITQRQTAEAQLRASEAELRALFAAMTDVILVRDRTGRCLKIAPTNSALLYKPASEQLNATLHEIFDRETADTFLSYIHQALDTRKTVQCEYSLPIGGVQRWFSASISPMLEDSVVWVARDVTKYKHTEEALRQAEEKYRSIFENAVEGIFQTLPCGRYLNANPALARIYGYSSPAALMEKLSDIAHQLYVDPRRRDEFMSLMQEHDQVSNFESQVYRCDGQIIWISESARAVRDAKGELVYYEGIVEDITNRKQVEEQLLYNAFHDALTGLPNRLMFMDRLQQALQRSKTEPEYRFAVLFLDLDRFKIVNDSLGHMAGDRLLIAFAQRLETVLLESIATRQTPPTDLAFTIARLGGDEFTILLENIQQASDATQIAEQIHQALTLPFSIDGHDIFTTSSIGIVLNWEIEINDWASEAGSNRGPVPISALEAEKGRWGELPSPAFTVGETYPLCLMRYSAEDLLRDADIAMYRAKAMGKARHAVFNAAMYAGAVARLQLETDLRRAVAAEEFLVYYQPIVSLESGQIAGFEALVRWRHPNQGLISPASFIPLAEETGLIVPLGTWVLREACRQMRRWQLQFPSDSPLSMSVNLSGQQFSQSDLISTFEEILRETGLEGRSLKVEITESVITEGAGAATAILQRLRELGIQLCIDDFGTGYSSLSRLHQFPINTLKIDRSFVSWLGKKGKGHWGGMAPGEIVQTILMLAHNLGMDAIAEGVETPEQLAQLKRHRCEYGQGYLFSKPLCSEAATALLADWMQVEEKRM